VISDEFADATVPFSRRAGKVVVVSPVPSTVPPAETSTPDAAVGPPWWLPASSPVTSIEVDHQQTDPAYEQLFVGNAVVDPPELLVQTIDTRPGLPDSVPSPTGAVPGEQTIRLGPGTSGHVAQVGGALELWWNEPDGVAVDATATGLSSTTLVALMSTATPAPNSRLGVELPGPLPAGLRPLRAAGSSHTNGWVEDVQIGGSGCQAEFDIYQGIPSLISAQDGTTTHASIAGVSALVETVPAAGTDVSWPIAPGLTADMVSNTANGPACAALTLARSVGPVSPARWAAEKAALGSHYSIVQPTVNNGEDEPAGQRLF
jgi:hypothetical protein